MAKVCDGCYGELKKRGGDVPGLMRGNLGTTLTFLPGGPQGFSLPHGWCLKPFSQKGSEQKQPSRKSQGFNSHMGHHFPKCWFLGKSAGTPR